MVDVEQTRLHTQAKLLFAFREPPVVSKRLWDIGQAYRCDFDPFSEEEAAALEHKCEEILENMLDRFRDLIAQSLPVN